MSDPAAYDLAASLVVLAVQSGLNTERQARAIELAGELLRLARVDNGPSRGTLTGSSPSGAASIKDRE